ncbi:putative F-box/FBD/LRR-repeat protein [Prunus yedoensis var. nudiflora]|uniref:Putative F-box/FBD/LRR-repeat protein n=1 Tax=Prunus yedoensis var. nudiflora TaxID=2094558 RepID=A0A314UKH4_PRUYE|nr:putative F-box/FBD/LRR-repeat protein [Prunus yedoensis var. nudiflora]
MERQKRKFVAAASCEGEGGRRGRMTDRLSNLPDQIAHVILSFLTMADLARLSYVSKCWRELCLSSPVLNFNEYDCIAGADMCDSKQRLLNILERFLLLRADHKIQRFRFDWHFPPPKKNQSSLSSCSCRDVYYRVMSCVQKAVRCNVEQLELNLLGLGEPNLNFPSSIFLCESLKSLSVYTNRAILRAPSSSSSISSNLKDLELLNVVIADDEGFFKWISCSCKCIRKLGLDHPYMIKNLNIESSSLERLSLSYPQPDLDTLNISCENLQRLSISLCPDSRSITSLNIFAPNLKKLWWAGNLMNHPNLRKFQSLESAEVYFDSVGKVSLEKTQKFKSTLIDLGTRVDEFEPLSEVFHGLRINEVLILNEAAIKVMFKLEGSMPVSFNNVRSLRMNIGCVIDEIVPSMVSKGRFDIGYWKLQNLGFINRLEFFTIEILDWYNVVELASYVLECAQKLKKGVIICSAQNLEEVKLKLEKCKMISKSAIVFKERPKSERRLLF